MDATIQLFACWRRQAQPRPAPFAAGWESRASREVRFLLACLRRAVRVGDSRLTGSLPDPQGLDWPALLETAMRHRVLPVLHGAAAALPAGSVPAVAAAALQRACRRNARRSLRIACEVAGLATAFADAQVPALHFKGPVLALQTCGDVTRRQAGDIDVLVDPLHFQRAKAVLLARGFRQEELRGRPLDKAQEAALLQRSSEMRFCSASQKVTVDLHWRLHRNERLSLDAAGSLRGAVTRVPLAGVLVPTLTAQDTVLHLALHGAKHTWERLSWILDLALLVERDDVLDWEALVGAAARGGNSRSLLLGVLVAHLVAGSRLPPPAAHAARREPALVPLLAAVEIEVCGDPAAPRGGLTAKRLRRLAYNLRLQRSVAYKLSVLRKVLEPAYAADWSCVRLPAALFPLYSAVRPLRLVWRHLVSRRS